MSSLWEYDAAQELVDRGLISGSAAHLDEAAIVIREAFRSHWYAHANKVLSVTEIQEYLDGS